MSKISLDPETERRLIKKTQRDKKAFAPLYKHYYPYIKRFFAIRLTDFEVVEDLTSKVFEKALLGIDSFQWQGVSFSAWLYKIAKNTLVDFFREQERTKRETSLSNIRPLKSFDKTPEEILIEMDSENELHLLLDVLPKREREIIYMKFFEGYTNRAIARLTGLSETNVGTIVYRTVRKLREKLLGENL